MGVPVSQMWTVASYVLKQRVKGRKRYPLVLMLSAVSLQPGVPDAARSSTRATC